MKSGSFSGVSRKQSDSSIGPRKCCENVSGTETDDDASRLKLPVFRLGPDGGAVTINSGKILTNIISYLLLSFSKCQY